VKEERGERVEVREMGRERRKKWAENDIRGPRGPTHFLLICVALTYGSHKVYYFSRMNYHVSDTSMSHQIKTKSN
jgi:hypothetical protein